MCDPRLSNRPAATMYAHRGHDQGYDEMRDFGEDRGSGRPRGGGDGHGRPDPRLGQERHVGAPVERGEIGRRLRWVLGLTAVFTVVEVVGGILSSSLALLADAGHMFTDVAALGLSVFAMDLARRPPTTRRTYGYARLEILAALLNGATLLLIAGLILVEAWGRLQEPREIDGVLMLSVAALGLLVNVVGAILLRGHAHDNLNVRGAYLHVLGDLLGSIGTMTAGVLVVGLGWTLADPIISVVIALLILYSAWNLVREATDVLLESAPPHIDMESLLADLSSIDGLHDIHDVHVWTLTSGFVALSGHGVIDDPGRHMSVLEEIRARMASRGIEHVTFQLELRTLHQLPEREGGG